MRLTAGGLVYCLYRSSCRNCETYVVKLQMILRRWTNGRHKLEPNRTIDGHKTVGTLWFAIFLQLFLILGVLHTLASDAIAMHRFQISVFGAVAIVFAVDGVNLGIFTGDSALDAMGAGWLLLSIVNILWVLYFTSEEDSLQLHIFNSMGTGGLSPPGRRRRGGRGPSLHMGGNGYTGSYGGGIGPSDVPYDTKMGGSPVVGTIGMTARSNASIGGGGGGSIGGGGNRSIGQTGSITGAQSTGAPTDLGVSSPLMGSGNAGVGAGGGLSSPDRSNPDTAAPSSGVGETYNYKAKALYACKFPMSLPSLP